MKPAWEGGLERGPPLLETWSGSLSTTKGTEEMRESSFELASRLRAEAEALEELFLEAENNNSYHARVEEESRLEELLGLAQDRLATLRLESLQEALEDVEAIVRGLRDDETRREEEGRPLGLIQNFIRLAESERVRLHHIIDAATRAEDESRRVRERGNRGWNSAERFYSGESRPRRTTPDVSRETPRRDAAAAAARPRKAAPVREVVNEFSDLDSI